MYLLNQLQPDELKFNARVYMGEGVYRIAATGEDAARFMRLLAVSAPSASGEYLSEKFNEFVEAAKFEVRLGDVRLIDKGRVAADLTISEAGVAVKYNIYLSEKGIELQFQSSNRNWVEFAARLLRHAGVSAEVRKVGSRDVWYVYASTDKPAAGHRSLGTPSPSSLGRPSREAGWMKKGKTLAGEAGEWACVEGRLAEIRRAVEGGRA
ncbi:MAG: hypothetical protein LM559_00665 [Pyrobaculum sp.]|nr:hypothetical protein [Pyrobaculum sp.]